jgi:small subunit ribosomal protein S5
LEKRPRKRRRYERKPEDTIKDLDSWVPKTSLGKKVKSGEIKDIEEIISKGMKITEPQIVEFLLSELDHDLLLIGQSKGKFGGGKRRAFRQTQKKTAEGNKPKFTTMAVCGNKDGYVGIGLGSSRETVPAREKALVNAKLNVTGVVRGCGSWECGCGEKHSIPYKISGRCGSVRVEIIPAPKGVGLCIHDECKKVLEFAGVKDVWSHVTGQSRTRINLIYACFEALKNLSKIKGTGEKK